MQVGNAVDDRHRGSTPRAARQAERPRAARSLGRLLPLAQVEAAAGHRLLTAPDAPRTQPATRPGPSKSPHIRRRPAALEGPVAQR
jgi:hypothetical protein